MKATSFEASVDNYKADNFSLMDEEMLDTDSVREDFMESKVDYEIKPKKNEKKVIPTFHLIPGGLVMKSLTRIVLCLFALVVASGCASTEITNHESKIGTKKIAKPERIYVYPFAATPADIPTWSVSANRYSESPTPQTPEELAVGRELGILVAKELITAIQKMGLSALQGSKHTVPRINNLLIAGYFEAIEKGSTAKRLTLGFGSGAAELTTAVEGYQMTPEGPRLLGSAELQSDGNKKPGLIVPLAVLAATANPLGLVVMGGVSVYGEVSGRNKIEGAAKRTAEAIADRLRVRFQEQGDRKSVV